MNSDNDRDMERERQQRDAVRAGFVEVEEGVWVRAALIEMVREARDTGHEREAASVLSLVGREEAFMSRLTPAQLLRHVVAAGGRMLP